MNSLMIMIILRIYYLLYDYYDDDADDDEMIVMAYDLLFIAIYYPSPYMMIIRHIRSLCAACKVRLGLT